MTSADIVVPRFCGQRHFQSALWFYVSIMGLYLLLSPAYVFHSGLPQPADYLIVLGMVPAFSIILLNTKLKMTWPYLAALLFVCMTVVINLVNYYFFPDKRFLLQSVIYIYNFSVFSYTAFVFRRYPEPAIKIAYLAIITTIAAQLMALQFFPDSNYRQSGLLNNPNQLCYWALLTLMMLVILKARGRFNVLDYGLIVMLFYIESAGLSKAGILAFAMTLFVIPFTPQFTKFGRLSLLLLVGGCIIFPLWHWDKVVNLQSQVESVDRVVMRIKDIGDDNDDSFDAREYDRLIDFPHYTLLGAGEGAFERFDREYGQATEIHSGLATIFFSYGILGGIFFTVFLVGVALRQPWYYAAFIGIVFMYGIPHQHLRFTHFWAFLGLLEASRHWPAMFSQAIMTEKVND